MAFACDNDTMWKAQHHEDDAKIAYIYFGYCSLMFLVLLGKLSPLSNSFMSDIQLIVSSFKGSCFTASTCHRWLHLPIEPNVRRNV